MESNGESEIVYLAIGSNLGPREANLVAAVEAIEADPATAVLAVSPIFETDPVGPGDQGCYLNAAIRIRTQRSPEALLDLLQSIESAAGRDRSEVAPRWSARTLDLDILFFGARCIARPGLSVPHPRAHERDFVLAPMVALAPEFEHPLLGRSMATLHAAVAGQGGVRPYTPPAGWPA